MAVDLKLVPKEPSTCRPQELAEFESLVFAGGKVQKQSLAQGIKRARMLVFAYYSDQLVGVAALKTPLNCYKKRIFKKAATELSPKNFNLEIGYVYVKPSCREKGISKQLVRNLLGFVGDENVFLSTETDNRMQKTLKQFEFVRTGSPYNSKISKKQLELFVYSKKPRT